MLRGSVEAGEVDHLDGQIASSRTVAVARLSVRRDSNRYVDEAVMVLSRRRGHETVVGRGRQVVIGFGVVRCGVGRSSVGYGDVTSSN
jgi:hypothetical protein